MRKKLLSLLTVLCLVLGMLPATAMAIGTANIDKTDEANVQVIAEDTELTGTIEKLVLVDAAVKVDVTDATLTVGLVVSPDAEGAEVTISGTTAAEVVVLANASVKTDAATTVETVTVDAAEATVEVAGEVASVVLTENAQGVSLTVAETATVAAVEVAAPNATVAVAGTVESVTVAETATGAELAVAETATVTTVTDATGELTVSGAGAESVTVENTTETRVRTRMPRTRRPRAAKRMPRVRRTRRLLMLAWTFPLCLLSTPMRAVILRSPRSLSSPVLPPRSLGVMLSVRQVSR